MELDNFYKFIIASFAIAYFIGLITGIIVVSINKSNYQETDITKSFYLTSNHSFKTLFTDTLKTSAKLMIFPFTYLIVGVKYGFMHAIYLLAPFLGQIKLAVLLIPEIFYFLGYIFFTTVGLKIMIAIIIFVINKWLLKQKIKIKIFTKEDSFLIYLSILGIAIGTAIQIYLSKAFFIFLINFQLITYILIVLIYATIISLSFLTLYKTIKSSFKLINKSEKI